MSGEYNTSVPQSVVVCLDALQTFDQIEWKFMFAKCGILDNALHLTQILHFDISSAFTAPWN